jgi:hypothetical protein
VPAAVQEDTGWNKKVAVALVVVALLLLGGLVVWFLRPSVATTPAARATTPDARATTPLSLIDIRRGISSTAYTPGNTTGWPAVQKGDENGGVLKFTGNSNTSGNYVSYPALTVDLAKGLTILVAFRFTKSADWQRILEFGNGPDDHTNNIVLCQNGYSGVDPTRPTNRLRFGIRRGPNGADEDMVEAPLVFGSVQVAIAQYDPARNRLSLQVGAPGTKGDVLTLTPPAKYTAARRLTTNYLGKSNWDGDSYANLDIFNLLVFNTLLTASQVETIVSTF